MFLNPNLSGGSLEKFVLREKNFAPPTPNVVIYETRCGNFP